MYFWNFIYFNVVNNKIHSDSESISEVSNNLSSSSDAKNNENDSKNNDSKNNDPKNNDLHLNSDNSIQFLENDQINFVFI